MNTHEALAAIDTLVKQRKLRKNSLAYKSIIEAVGNPGKIVSCGKKIGSGNYSSSTSWKTQVVVALTQAGIPYSSGNSAPRGGVAGDNVAVHLDLPETGKLHTWAAEINKDWDGAYRAIPTNENIVVTFEDKEAARIDYTGGRYSVSGTDKEAVLQLEYMVNG